MHGALASGLRAAALRRLASDTRLRTQSLFAKQGPPRGLPRGERSRSGGERRKERSRAELSPLGGSGVGGVSSDDMGGANGPAINMAESPLPNGSPVVQIGDFIILPN